MATLPVEDGTLWYEEQGTGPPLVFLHGNWLDADSWRKQVETFADTHRVITPEFRGHGRSPASDRRPYSVSLFTDDLEALLAHLEVERPTLCGISLGSAVVQTYLARHPGGAAGAVLAGAMRSMPPVGVPPAAKPFLTPTPGLGFSTATLGTRATFRSLLNAVQTATGGPWLAVDPDVRSRAVETVAGVSPAEFTKTFDALYRFDAPDLAGVTVPTLAVCGEREALAVKRQGEAAAAAVEEGSTAEIPDAGHLVNRDAPEAFDAAVSSFLASLEA